MIDEVQRCPDLLDDADHSLRKAPLPSPARGDGWGYIESVYVAEPSRRRGLGRRLAEKALNELAARGATRIGIAVMYANSSAMAFWPRLGFEPMRIILVRPAA